MQTLALALLSVYDNPGPREISGNSVSSRRIGALKSVGSTSFRRFRRWKRIDITDVAC